MNMFNESLISFETAKLAKEKGLPRFLNLSNDLSCYNLRNKQLVNYHVHIDFPPIEEYLYAPTQALLQKWLREEHFLYVEPKRSHFDGYLGIAVFKCNVIDGTYDDVKGKSYIIRTDEHMLDFNTYEEALEMGLFRGLQFIGVGTIRNY